MGTIIVLGIVVLVVGAVWYGIEMAKIQKSISERLASDWPDAEFFVSSNDHSFIGVDFTAQTVILGKGDHETSYDFKRIAKVELVENGATLTQTNRGSQLLGAAVGGLALGGVGAIVGGLSGSSRSSDRIKHLFIRIVVDDTANPLHQVTFLDCRASKKGWDSNGFLAKSAIETANRFHALLINSMRRASEAAPQVERSEAPPNPTDALERLWALHTAGAISRDEYDRQKASVIS